MRDPRHAYAPYLLLKRASCPWLALRTYAPRINALRALAVLQISMYLSGSHANKFNIVKNDHWHTKMWIFSFIPETRSLGKFDPKNQNCYSKLKFDTQTNSNMQNSMRMLNFSVFDEKYPCWVNLVQISKLSVSVETWYLNLY